MGILGVLSRVPVVRVSLSSAIIDGHLAYCRSFLERNTKLFPFLFNQYQTFTCTYATRNIKRSSSILTLSTTPGALKPSSPSICNPHSALLSFLPPLLDDYPPYSPRMPTNLLSSLEVDIINIFSSTTVSCKPIVLLETSIKLNINQLTTTSYQLEGLYTLAAPSQYLTSFICNASGFSNGLKVIRGRIGLD